MIRHVMKDGSRPATIDGMVVRMKQVRGAYAAMERTRNKKDEGVQRV